MSEINNNCAKYAVIIGNNNYEGSGLGNLNFCANDAQAFYDALLQYAKYDEENIMLFSDGGHIAAKPVYYTDILSAVKEMCSKATENDSILFFFAGHGTRDEKDSYLLTKEYRSNVINDSSITMKKINEYFSNSAAKFKLRFFDACHSGRFGVRGLSNPSVETDLAIDAEGWATLASCREEQYAHELSQIGHGVFSYFLIRGLSGDASINNENVSLDNLKVYVMNQTISFTRKIGVEQTPVFSGEQAGTLILSVISNKEKDKISEILNKIEQSNVQELEPVSNDTEKLISQLANLLKTDNESQAFIAKNQEEKLNFISNLVSYSHEWAKQQAEIFTKQLPSNSKLIEELCIIQKAPLNRELAQFLNNSKVRTAIEWNFSHSTETRYKKENYTEVQEPTGFYSTNKKITRHYSKDAPYEVDVIDGITQYSNTPHSTVLLTFEPGSHLYPQCCMVVSAVPTTFGIYSICYFASSELDKDMKELWNENSFSLRFIYAVPIQKDLKKVQQSKLDQALAEFISFIEETSKIRKIQLSNLGAVPNTDLA